MTKRTLLLGLAGVAGAAVLGDRVGSRPDPGADGGPLSACGPAPNCARVRVPLAAPVERAQAAAVAAVQAHGSWRTGRAVAVEPTASGARATFAVGPFRDRLAVAVEGDGAGGSVLWVKSEARVGRSDLGVNRARARRIADETRARLG